MTALKEHYRETVTWVVLQGAHHVSRTVQTRRVYRDRDGYRFVRSRGNHYYLNSQNEWFQPAEHLLRKQKWEP